MQLTLEEITKNIENLPCLPEAVVKVLNASENLDAPSTVISDLISVDKSLTLRILKLVNSAFYSQPQKINTINEAVIILGLSTIRNLTLISTAEDWFFSFNTEKLNYSKKLWEHSFAVAVGAQFLSEYLGRGSPDNCFTAGLLHNIGKVALKYYFHEDLNNILRLAEENHISFVKAEKSLIGYDHTEIGEYLALKWNMPKDITQSIRYHHFPEKLEIPSIVIDIVYASRYLVAHTSHGLEIDSFNYVFSEEPLSRIKTNFEQLKSLIGDFLTFYEGFKTQFVEN